MSSILMGGSKDYMTNAVWYVRFYSAIEKSQKFLQKSPKFHSYNPEASITRRSIREILALSISATDFIFCTHSDTFVHCLQFGNLGKTLMCFLQIVPKDSLTFCEYLVLGQLVVSNLEFLPFYSCLASSYFYQSLYLGDIQTSD